MIDVPNSGVALATSEIARAKNKVFIVLRRRLVRSHRREVQRQHGALDLRHLDAGERHRQGDGEDRRRHLVLPDRRLCVRSCARARHDGGGREGNGGKVLGKVRHPLNTNDFSSFLLQAQTSKAKIIGLANAGGDTINSIKAGAEFGIAAGGQKFAGLLVFASDVECARAADRAGSDPDRDLVLGRQRRQPRLDQALAGRAAGQVPDHGAGRRLFRPDALPQGGRGAEERAATARRWSPR